MNFKNKFVAVILAVLALFGINFSVSQVGSVAVGNEYQATTTGSFGSATSTLVFLGVGSIGSVVVASTTSTTLEVWDASGAFDSSSTTVAKFAASPANGTYTFDVEIKEGLFLNFPAGYAGAYTVTYRR